MRTSNKIRLPEGGLKIRFIQTREGGILTELVVCIQKGGVFEIAEVPLVVKDLALGDIVKADYDEENKGYFFDTVVARSGSSTFRIFCTSKDAVWEAKEMLDHLGCCCRIFLQRYMIGVSVPKNVNFHTVQHFLDTGQAQSRWKFSLVFKGEVLPQFLAAKTKETLDKHVSVMYLRIGTNLKNTRDARNHSLNTVAEKTGIDEMDIYRLESGIVENFGLTSFLRLCTFYGSNPGDALK